MISQAKPVLYTVGHSNHEIDHFLRLLRMNEIKAIADVRSSPFSRYTSQFNQDQLSSFLKRHGIHYVFLGRELGARREETECYRDGKVIYGNVATQEAFRVGMLRLQKGAAKMRVAVMCTEKDPLTCHRTILVAHYGHDLFGDIRHILDDGSIETQEEADNRLLAELGMNEEDLFCSREDRIELAYEKRGEKIAYEAGAGTYA